MFLKDRLPNDFWQHPYIATRAEAATGILSLWLLLPEKRPYDDYRLLEFDPASPGIAKAVLPSEGVTDSGGTIIYWTLLAPRPGARYECHWRWKRPQGEPLQTGK